MTAKIEYRLIGAGWAICDVAVEDLKATVAASYLGDTLNELLCATLSALEGTRYSAARFCDEPSEYRFVLMPKDGFVRVRILEFSELWSDEPDDFGAIRLDAICGLREFAEAVLSAARAVLNTHGIKGYKENWGRHEFPLEAMNKLSRALGVATLQ
ncbi:MULTISPECIES: hypothetical protein [unclassified Mesorhizobium]|uniref:hypothetical protein n=1 Tax=unclassified Mesorhizobium TaxID=325217 RepID=UPI000FCA73FF|nr:MULTISPECIES: hypothetical protein [unclassified Mesorhizobium]RUV39004.1 hypothetical protein EOB49_04565 [Mesorhizobium sp. M7A.F.Ca.MR.148.00.0.0]RWQ16645.1 MAG: hypothetical protein EOR93_23630 [Mesorhizobium sp.]TIN67331.1 MAG: hypothetical protein E5Y30_28195 [Mesorhizobium sp.]